MDGYLLWPSRHPNPHNPPFHSERDLVGDLTQAVRARGLKMGLYYCGGYDATFNTTVIRDLLTAVTAIPQSREYADYAAAQFTELIERYQPSILWNDIAYPAGADVRELLAFYYNTVSDGVVNDRWAKVRLPRSRAGKALLGGALRGAALLWTLLPRSWRRMQMLPAAHCDYTTPEYDVRSDISERKWESVRGMGHSFGNNREERDEDLPSGERTRAPACGHREQERQPPAGYRTDARGHLPRDADQAARGAGRLAGGQRRGDLRHAALAAG